LLDFPPELHRKLQDLATRHRRSLAQEALALIGQAVAEPVVPRPIAADLLLKVSGVVRLGGNAVEDTCALSDA
jgi:plasmid stability protein